MSKSERKEVISHDRQAIFLVYSRGNPSGEVRIPDHYKTMVKLMAAMSRSVEGSPAFTTNPLMTMPIMPAQQIQSAPGYALQSPVYRHGSPRLQSQSPQAYALSQALQGTSPWGERENPFPSFIPSIRGRQSEPRDSPLRSVSPGGRRGGGNTSIMAQDEWGELLGGLRGSPGRGQRNRDPRHRSSSQGGRRRPRQRDQSPISSSPQELGILHRQRRDAQRTPIEDGRRTVPAITIPKQQLPSEQSWQATNSTRFLKWRTCFFLSGLSDAIIK